MDAHQEKRKRHRKKEKNQEEARENRRKKWRVLLTQKSSDEAKMEIRRRKSEKVWKKSKKRGTPSIGEKRRVHSSGFQHNLSVTGISLLMGVQRKDRVTSQKPEEQKDARKAHGC